MPRRTSMSRIVGLVLAIGCASEDDGDDTTAATLPAESDDGATAPADDDNASVDDGVDDGPATTPDDDGPATTDPSDTGGDDGPPVTTGPVDTGDDGPAETGDDGPVETGDGPAETGDGGPAQECLDMAANDCEVCACENCLPQLQACQMDPGCVEIRMCAQENMCTGIECLGPCGDVIDANGGAFGESASLASDLSDCYEGACPGC